MDFIEDSGNQLELHIQSDTSEILNFSHSLITDL